MGGGEYPPIRRGGNSAKEQVFSVQKYYFVDHFRAKNFSDFPLRGGGGQYPLNEKNPFPYDV